MNLRCLKLIMYRVALVFDSIILDFPEFKFRFCYAVSSERWHCNRMGMSMGWGWGKGWVEQALRAQHRISCLGVALSDFLSQLHKIHEFIISGTDLTRFDWFSFNWLDSFSIHHRMSGLGISASDRTLWDEILRRFQKRSQIEIRDNQNFIPSKSLIIS